jgi:hypothetical protein
MGARPHGDLIRANAYVAGGEIKIGDFVMLASSGKVVVAAASNAILGVALNHAPADGDEVIVSDHPAQEYLVERSSTAPSAQTDYFLNYDIVASASSSIESAHKLDSSSGATTPSTLPLRAVSNSRAVVPSSGPSECVVRINNHSERPGQVGV